MLSVKLSGRQTTRSLSEKDARRISKLTESYRRFRRARSELNRLFAEMKQLAAELEEALCVSWEKILSERERRQR